MIRKAYRSLWSQNRHFVLARNGSLHLRLANMLRKPQPAYGRIFSLWMEAAHQPEKELAIALADLWFPLQNKATKVERAEVLLTLARDPLAARIKIHSLARKYGFLDLLVSRVFMHPSQLNQVWIEGKAGWSLYCVFGRQVIKQPLWLLAYQLASVTASSGDAYRFGGVLRLLERKPRSYFELARELGQPCYDACRELMRRILIYPLETRYYPNRQVISHFREQYHDAVGRGVTLKTCRWSRGHCRVRFSDGRTCAYEISDLVGQFYDLAGTVAGGDAYGMRAMLKAMARSRSLTEKKLRLESGRTRIRYPLSLFLEHRILVPGPDGTLARNVPLLSAVGFYDRLFQARAPKKARRRAVGQTP